jgi:hypothetical protein
MNPDRPLAPHYAAQFGPALIRVLRGMSLTALAATLVAALAVAEILLLEPAVVRPALGYLATAVLGGLSLWGALRFRRAFRRMMTAALATVVVCAVLNLVLFDGLFGSMFALLGDPAETIYSEGYSGWRFWRVTKGTTREQVLDSLGEPLMESWVYIKRPESADSQVILENDKVINVERENDPRLTRVTVGMTRRDLLGVAGSPLKPPSGTPPAGIPIRSEVFDSAKTG